MACVYCFRVGSFNRFKIGRTKGRPESRRKNLSTGSADKLTLWRELPSDHANDLETLLHRLLELKRAPNGEFFDVSEAELSEAIDQALTQLQVFQPAVQAASKLRARKPSSDVLDPTPELVGLHEELRMARRDKFFLDQRILLLESKIQVAIGENSAITGIATWTWRDRWELNEKLLKLDQPEIYERYRHQVGSRVFLVK